MFNFGVSGVKRTGAAAKAARRVSLAINCTGQSSKCEVGIFFGGCGSLSSLPLELPGRLLERVRPPAEELGRLLEFEPFLRRLLDLLFSFPLPLLDCGRLFPLPPPATGRAFSLELLLFDMADAWLPARVLFALPAVASLASSVTGETIGVRVSGRKCSGRWSGPTTRRRCWRVEACFSSSRRPRRISSTGLTDLLGS